MSDIRIETVEVLGVVSRDKACDDDTAKELFQIKIAGVLALAGECDCEVEDEDNEVYYMRAVYAVPEERQ